MRPWRPPARSPGRRRSRSHDGSAGVREGGRGGVGRAVAGRPVAERDARDGDPERGRDGRTGRRRVGHPLGQRLDRQPQPELLEHGGQLRLRHPQVAGGRPRRGEQWAHGLDVAAEHRPGAGIGRIEVDPALGSTAERAGQCLLVGHGAARARLPPPWSRRRACGCRRRRGHRRDGPAPRSRGSRAQGRPRRAAGTARPGALPLVQEPRPAAARRTSALSVCSHVKSSSSRPKCP